VSLFHVPLNMGSMFTHTWNAIKQAHADNGQFLVMSHDQSAWHAEHLFAVTKDVPHADMVRLSGDFLTKVFEGPFSDARKWCAAIEQFARRAAARRSLLLHDAPALRKHYGKNYVCIAKVR
jgi:hypothetical protein